ncbi:unnamed protein product, partial [Polarella glacialis]
ETPPFVGRGAMARPDASADMMAVQNSFQNLKIECGKSDSQGGSADGSKKAAFTYNAERVLGSGSFGVVYQAQ